MAKSSVSGSGLHAPSAHLTEAFLKAAVAGIQAGEIQTGKDGRRWWRDEGSPCGLRVVVSRRGAVFYRRSRKRGSNTPVFERIGDATKIRVAEARARALKLAGGQHAAAEPVRFHTGGITCGEAFDSYVAAARAGKFVVGRKRAGESTLKSYEQLFNPHVRPAYGHRGLGALAAGVKQLLDGLRDRPTTMNRTGQVLKNLFLWSAENGHWRHANPMVDPLRGRPIAKEAVQARDRFLTNAEAAALLTYLHAHEPGWADFFELLLLTAVRSSNLREMRWSQLDLDAGVWGIPKTKSGQPLLVPLTPRAVAILVARRATADTKSPFVFPRRDQPHLPVSDLAHAWNRIRKGAAIPDVRIHDLRRTAASWAVQGGIPLPGVGKFLGHTSSQATSIYARADTTLARQAAAVVESRLHQSRSNNGEDSHGQAAAEQSGITRHGGTAAAAESPAKAKRRRKAAAGRHAKGRPEKPAGG